MIKGVRAAAALVVPILAFSGMSAAQARADLFKSGRVRLVQEVRVTDENLPENAPFQNPRGLAVDAQGLVYVADLDAGHIKVFGPDGKFRTLLGRKGQGPGEFQAPSLLAASGGRLAVWDVMDRRFSILDLKGVFIRSAPTVYGSYGEMIALRALPDGRFIAFVERGLPPKFEGRFPDERDYAVLLLSADLAPVKTLYEKKIRDRVWTRHPETKGLLQVGFPYHPGVEADVSPAGIAAVGLGPGYDIELLDPDKGLISAIHRNGPRIKLEERDKQAHFNSFKMFVFVGNKKTVVNKAPSYVAQLTEFPEFFPAFNGLIFDGRGRLWVQVFTADRNLNVFDIFSAKGEYINRVEAEGPKLNRTFTTAYMKCFAGDNLWIIERDEEEFPSLVKYRLEPGSK